MLYVQNANTVNDPARLWFVPCQLCSHLLDRWGWLSTHMTDILDGNTSTFQNRVQTLDAIFSLV